MSRLERFAGFTGGLEREKVIRRLGPLQLHEAGGDLGPGQDKIVVFYNIVSRVYDVLSVFE